MAGTGNAHLRGEGMVLRANDINVEFKLGDKKVVKAVSGVSIDIAKGETLAVVGESGCGKSSLGKALLQLPKPTSGSVILNDVDITALHGEKLRAVRPQMQMIFQDPYSSLNPRMRVGEIIGEPLVVHSLAKGSAIKEQVLALMQKVGLAPEHYDRYPHEFSGGQRQRIGIARTIALKPKLIICDESVSALDVSVQANLLNLLKDLQEQFSLTLLFVSHDLAVIRQMCDRVIVMKDGEALENGSNENIFEQPKHAYTRSLLDAMPKFQGLAQS